MWGGALKDLLESAPPPLYTLVTSNGGESYCLSYQFALNCILTGGVVFML